MVIIYTVCPSLNKKGFIWPSLLCRLNNILKILYWIIEPLKNTRDLLMAFYSTMIFLLMKFISFRWHLFWNTNFKMQDFCSVKVLYVIKKFALIKIVSIIKCTNFLAVILWKPFSISMTHVQDMNFCLTPYLKNTF